MHSLSAGTLQQVVDASGNEQAVALFLKMDKTLVGMDDLFEVNGLTREISERVFSVVVLIKLFELAERYFVVKQDGSKDAPGEIAMARDEIDLRVKTSLLLTQCSLHLGQVLVHKRLIDADIVAPPAEAGKRGGALGCARAADDAEHVDVAVEHKVSSQW